jgi:uncharacterized membrane protein AbrB (regulator of aidB expression)
LSVFVLLHLLFAPLLRLLLRAPNVTLGASLLLYALVHVLGWTVPGWPNSHWAFNPLGWTTGRASHVFQRRIDP